MQAVHVIELVVVELKEFTDSFCLQVMNLVSAVFANQHLELTNWIGSRKQHVERQPFCWRPEFQQL